MEGNAPSPEVRVTVAPHVNQRIEAAKQKAAQDYHAAHTQTAHEAQADTQEIKKVREKLGFMKRLKRIGAVMAAALNLYVASPIDEGIIITGNMARTTQSEPEVPLNFPKEGLATRPADIDPKRSIPGGSK